jgi:hypothetical protein
MICLLSLLRSGSTLVNYLKRQCFLLAVDYVDWDGSNDQNFRNTSFNPSQSSAMLDGLNLDEHPTFPEDR